MSRGPTYRPTDHWERLPEKKKNKHRWVGVASFHVTDEAMRGAIAGEDQFMDSENLLDFGIGCIDCEQPYPSVKNQICRAKAFQP